MYIRVVVIQGIAYQHQPKTFFFLIIVPLDAQLIVFTFSVKCHISKLAKQEPYSRFEKTIFKEDGFIHLLNIIFQETLTAHIFAIRDCNSVVTVSVVKVMTSPHPYINALKSRQWLNL